MYIEERDDAIDLRKDENIQVRHELDFDYLSLLGLLAIQNSSVSQQEE